MEKKKEELTDLTNVKIEDLNFKLVERIKKFLLIMIEKGGSDLHVKANSKIRARVNGEIISLTEEILTHEESLLLAKELLKVRFQEFEEKKSLDFTFVLNSDYRFRVNIFFQLNGVSAVFRVIPTEIPYIDTLGLPDKIKDLSTIKKGLILVTGPTGSGKSTTLSSFINYINLNYSKHIITIEDPIEFVFDDHKSIVNQRAIGQDTLDFKTSLKAALREDPDIIFVGEMRDQETIEIALHAAETGHLVVSTLHTVDSKETLNRVISTFPPEEQFRIRKALGSVLQAVVSQRLVRTIDNKRAAAIELLIKTARIEEMIYENRDDEITQAIEEGHDTYGTQTFDQALLELYKVKKITESEALMSSSNSNDLKLKIDFYNNETEYIRLEKEKSENKEEGDEEDSSTSHLSDGNTPTSSGKIKLKLF